MGQFVRLAVVLLLLTNAGKAQYVNLPDTNFRNYLIGLYPACFNDAGLMDTTCTQIVSETLLFPIADTNRCITSADGIQYFKNLRTLWCIDLTCLDLSTTTLPRNLNSILCRNIAAGPSALPPYLQSFNCSGSGFTQLPDLPPYLTDLSCSGSNLTSLPAMPLSLKSLQCGGNNLTSLPLLPSGLEWLECSDNLLSTLPILPVGLRSLYCRENSLTNLPDLPSGLWFIECYSNSLTTLPALPGSLKNLFCANNPLGRLPALPDSLIVLEATNTLLQELPALPESIVGLHVGNNLLTALPILPQSLILLTCNKNSLNSLPRLPGNLKSLRADSNNIHCLPRLPDDCEYIVIDSKIKCIPNKPVGFQVYVSDENGLGVRNFFPLCSPVNNEFRCGAFPVTRGNIFIDLNNNAVKDAGEPAKINNRINLLNSSYTFSDDTGQFEIGADSIGNFALTIAAPRYYRYTPVSFDLDFTTYDTIITDRNFALQIDSIADEITIHVTPINPAARPGFSYPYIISYENTGTTTLSSNIVFDYDQTKLNYNTSSEAGVVDNAGNLTYNIGTLIPGQAGSFIGYFTLKANVPLGDTLNAKAVINAGTFTAFDSVRTIVIGAYDPNDKQATPQLSPSQVANGEYIDYTIRFQNTGTDTAFTVVISDTLSDDLQANSLQMITSSHNCKTTVKDNIVFFEFLNILLPDSNINEPLSHGFVSFKMKPQTSVSANTTILNKAAIYFDYNAPVITNTAGTLIKDFIVLPLRLISFNAVPQNDNTTSLYWKTSNEINTQYFVVERSSDGTAFTSIANVFANGRVSNQYNSTVADPITGIVFYRLKIVDNNGSFVYSPVVKIDRRKNTAGFSLLSNPVKDFIIINTTDRSLHNTLASIINMQGAVVKTFIVKEGSQVVDINNLPNGVYLMRTVNGSSRIVIQ